MGVADSFLQYAAGGGPRPSKDGVDEKGNCHLKRPKSSKSSRPGMVRDKSRDSTISIEKKRRATHRFEPRARPKEQAWQSEESLEHRASTPFIDESALLALDCGPQETVLSGTQESEGMGENVAEEGTGPEMNDSPTTPQDQEED